MNVDHLPNAPGVYLLKHKLTGDSYVGMSSGIRWRVVAHLHAIRAGDHFNSTVRALVEKHGGDFETSVLEVTTIDGCQEAEHRWIQKLQPTLNHNNNSGRPFKPPTRPWHGKGLIPLNSRVHPILLAKLKAIARADDRTLSYMVERAVREFVERHHGKLPPKKK